MNWIHFNYLYWIAFFFPFQKEPVVEEEVPKPELDEKEEEKKKKEVKSDFEIYSELSCVLTPNGNGCAFVE